MPFHTYILHCADRSYYTGHTDDLDRRVAQHQSGALRGYTYERRPVELVWTEEFQTREEALSAELKIKNWSRAKKEALIAKDWDRLKHLSHPPHERNHPTSTPDFAPPRSSRAKSRDYFERSEKPNPNPNPNPTTNPIIVLVRPQLGENIGKAARAMLNFGLTELRLVAPRDGWPNPSAGPAAAGADIVLANASVHQTLAEAIADCANVYATTVRKRGVTKPVVTPEQAAREIHGQQGCSAIVFGPERSGLETDEVAIARAILTVPINPEFASLNLAQAVILCAYEWSKHARLSQPTAEELLPPATQEELDGLIAHLEALLTPKGYFKPPSRAAATHRTLRTMLTKPGWNHLEVRTLRGVLSAIEKRRDEP